ncbi:hypothetical protein ACHAPT_000308 [Fusarium lateritium]
MASLPTDTRHSGRCKTMQAYFAGSPGVGLRMLLHRICYQGYEDDLPYDPTGEDGRRMVMAQRGPVILNCDVIRSDAAHNPAMVKWAAEREDALICVYSVADRSSFEHLQTLCKDIPLPPPPEGAVLFVAASKTDLPDWKVSLEEGRQLSSSIGAEFLIMSAKTGAGCGDDDVVALVDHVYLGKAKAEEERKARAANQAAEESVAGKSKVHLMVSRVVQRLKRLRDKQGPEPGDSPGASAGSSKTQG